MTAAVTTAPSTASLGYTYYVGDSTYTVTPSPMAFTSSFPSCGSFVYSLSLSCSGCTTYDPTIFSIISTTGVVTLYTNNLNNRGTYTVSIVGHQSTYTFNSKSTQTFTIVVGGLCSRTTISTTSVSPKTYNVGTPQLDMLVTPFTESVGGCGSFTYTATISPTWASIITFDNTTPKFSVLAASTDSVD